MSWRAVASRKTHSMLRSIYSTAEGITKVCGLDGKKVYSATAPHSIKVCRGVIQGEIISPIFFILAMEQVFHTHDLNPWGITIDNHLLVSVLGCADDAD